MFARTKALVELDEKLKLGGANCVEVDEENDSERIGVQVETEEKLGELERRAIASFAAHVDDLFEERYE